MDDDVTNENSTPELETQGATLNTHNTSRTTLEKTSFEPRIISKGQNKLSDPNNEICDNSSIPMVQLGQENTSNLYMPHRGMSKRRIVKNMFVLNIAFVLIYIAYGGLADLQSSLHFDQGIGVVCQAILSGSTLLSCWFLPTLVIGKLGQKWTIVIAMIGYIIWMAANAYAVWGTMVSASIIVGLSSGPLWTGHGSYINYLAKQYIKKTKQTTKASLAFFFGIFFTFFPCGGMFGAMVSSVVLNPKQENYTVPSWDELQFCGMDDSPWNNNTNINFERRPPQVVWTVVGIYVGIAIVGLLMTAIFLDSVPLEMTTLDKAPSIDTKRPVAESFMATFKHLRYRNQRLLIIFSMFYGTKETFLVAEYYKSWITCYLGIWMVGWVSLVYYGLSGINSIIAGRMVKFVGRLKVFTAGFVFQFVGIMTLMFWKPNPDAVPIFFVTVIFWGISDGMTTGQTLALYGALFPKSTDAAYANHSYWMAWGFTISYSYSAFLCTSTKLYIVLGVFLAAMVAYYLVELLERRKKRKADNASTRSESKKELDGNSLLQQEAEIKNDL